MNVTLPDGTTIEGVPDGTTKDQLAQKLKDSGRDVPQEWFNQKEATNDIPTAENLKANVGKAPEYGALDKLRGGVEAAAALVTSPANLLSPLTGGRISGYQPTTASGKDYTERVGQVLDESKLAGLAPEGPSIIRGAPTAGKLLKEEAGIAKEALPSPPKRELTGESAKKQQVLQNAVEAGYVVPPKDAPKSGITTKTLGSISGKRKTEQEASIRNQEVTNNLVKKELGLPEQHPITPESLGAIREDAGKAYKAITRIGTPFKADTQYYKDVREIGGISNSLAEKYPSIGKNPEIENIRKDLAAAEHDPEHAIELTKVLRKQGNANRMAAERTADPKTRALADAQLKGARAIEDLIERRLSESGNKKLVDDFRASRKKIAQTYDVERVLDPSGNVVAGKLAKRADKLTGELKKAADFAAHFPKSTQNASVLGGIEDYSILDAAGIAASASHGNPGGLGALGDMLVGRSLVRKAILSKTVQRSLADLPMLNK